MGMHEFENVVEGSIRLLAREGADNLDLRSIVYALYKYQSQFDTGFTNFRLIDILLAHRYAYKFSVNEHPDYGEHKRFLDALGNDFAHIQVNPSQAWDCTNNPTAGYYQHGYLYCDAGSRLWQRFVDAGVLQGRDARPPVPMKLSDIVAKIVSLAEVNKEIGLIRTWYPLFILDTKDFNSAATLRSLKDDDSIQVIRSVTKRTAALDIEMSYGLLTIPPLEEICDQPILYWWFDLNQTGKGQRD